jgi:hypothetical protein
MFAEPRAVISTAISSPTIGTQQTGFGNQGPKTKTTAIYGGTVDGKAGSQYTADYGVRFTGELANETGKQAQFVAGYSVSPETVCAV